MLSNAFFGLLKSESYYRKKFSTTFHLEIGFNRFINYYNKRRMTLKFNGLTPLMFRINMKWPIKFFTEKRLMR
ncbi:IS3 family transposase [Marinilactibacillus kalidii]|uniref:IS3 family transposase n=1 Tax=Marinilactibacillus kalidii TaxID=2820274 RepID=UPI001ABE9A33